MLLRSLVVLVLGSVWLSSTAQAGPVEVLDWVDIKPGEPNTLVMRYRWGNGGLFISHDQGKTFALVCNSSVDSSVQRDGAVTMLRSDGTILFGVFDGLWRGDGDGCNWQNTKDFESKWINDFARDPTDPDRTFTITSAGGEENGIYVNTVGDDAWQAVGTQEKVLIGRLHVVSLGKGKLRFYESIVRGEIDVMTEGGTTERLPNYVIRHSDDMGETWTEHDFGPTDGTVRLLAVDPSDPDRIVVGALRLDLSSEAAIDELFWSAERGKPGSFEKITELGELGGIDFTPEGRLFYGDDNQNTPSLFTLSALGEKPEQLSDDYRVSCLRYDAQTERLYVCQQQRFGTADPKTGELTELYDIKKAETFASCGAPGEVQATCKTQLIGAYCGITHFFCAPLCLDYEVKDLDGKLAPESELCIGDAGVAPSADAGAMKPDAATGDAGKQPPDDDDAEDDGCSVSNALGARHERGDGLAWLSCLTLALAAVVLRRRSR